MNAPAPNMTMDMARKEPDQRPARLVVCGEISSGKSSVINAMVRKNVSPSFFGQERRPLVKVRHGSRPHAMVHFAGGESEMFDRVERCKRLAEATVCEIIVDAPHLKGIELIELTFAEHGFISEPVKAVLDEADLMIWTTICSQAWRLTEKTLVMQMPKGLHERSVLAVSRGDKLKSARDLDRIRKRLEGETEEFFDEIVFMGAAKKAIETSATSNDAFEKSGGKRLSELVAGFYEALSAIPGRFDIVEPEPEPEPTPQPEPEVRPDPTSVQAVAAMQADAAAAAVHAGDETDSETVRTLREMIGGMNGVFAAGIADCEHGACLHNLGGEQAIVEATAWVSQECQKLQAINYNYLTANAEFDQTMITMERHFLVYRPLQGGSKVLFILCRTEKINPGIARNALQRMSQVWDLQRA